MDQAVDRSEIEVIELDESDLNGAFRPEKLVGVALLGAATSLLCYYLYNQVDPERKERIKASLWSAVRGQVRKWGEEDEA